jgi:hypothetical protein
MSLAGVVLVVFLVTAGIAHRRWEAEAQIAANAVPIPGADIPPSETHDEGELSMADARVDHEMNVRETAAQREEVEASEPVAVAQVTTSKTAATSSASGTAGNPAATTPSPRYDFDLEHGTPMPPETRSGKPAY